MSLQEQIKADMVVAMKANQRVKLTFLRVISGELATNEKRKEKEKLDEQDILKKMAKNAKEAVKLVADFELEILDKYLIKVVMLEETQLKTVVAGIIQACGYSGMKDMGKVMGELKNLASAPQIDMKLANGIVRELLTQ
jgi:uncharacterized protein YqeY